MSKTEELLALTDVVSTRSLTDIRVTLLIRSRLVAIGGRHHAQAVHHLDGSEIERSIFKFNHFGVLGEDRF